MFPKSQSPSGRSPSKRPLGPGRDSIMRPDRRRLITQQQLERFRWLEVCMKMKNTQRQDLQKQLVALYEQQADVEPGPLDLEHVESHAKIFNFENVAAAIGTAEASEIRRKLAPTVTTSFKVVGPSRS